MSEEDDKKEKQTADLLYVQNRAKEYQEQIREIQNREYTGKVQGITITMKGTMEVIEVHIDQSFYETSAKGGMEIAFMKCINNIERSIRNDMEEVNNNLNSDIERLRVNSNGNY